MGRLLIALVLTLNISYLHAQGKVLTDPQAYFTAIIVSDMETSLPWYVRAFEFDVLNQVDLPQRGIKQANLKRGEIQIELIELKGSLSTESLLADQPAKTKMQGFFKFGMLISDFEEWINHLEGAQVTFNGDIVKDPLSGKRTVLILDPDGNRIQLFEQ